MKKTFSLALAIVLIAALLAACAGAPAAAPTAAPAAALTAAPAAAEPTKAPAAAAPADLKGTKACYLIPALSNTFLNTLATSVKTKAAADGIEVFVYGADDGGATAQYSQIENCISMGVKAMIVMAPGSIENVLPAVEEAKKAGIKVIGVPPGELEPFDAIMHTDQLEDGTKIAEMACNFINATYPDAADGSVEVAIIGNESGEKQMNLRYQGMRTITKNCPKANLVQAVDTSVEGIAAAASTAENILTAHANVKVFLVSSSAQAQGVAQTIKALPSVDISKYGVFAGDMDPTMIPTVKGCQDPYKGLVAIGGTNLDQATYDLLKKVMQGVEYPKITNDVLEPIFCESAPAAASPAEIKGTKVCYLLPTLANTFLNSLATSVKEKAAADGVEVFVYGAEEGGATAQYSQIENCISMGVKGMIVMAPGSIENVIPAVEEAKKAGIKVIGVPPGDLEPFDAIMHTDQYEDGTLVAKMACDFINATYPDAPDKGVEVVVMGNESGEKQMNLRYQGYRTIADTCPKANVVQYVDTPQTADSIPAGASAAENVLAAHPNVKVFVIQSSAQAQGAAQTIKALPGVDVSKYGVFAGDMDPSMIETIKGCQDPYKGLVAIGGTDLDQATYDLLKKVLQGVEYPKITNDRLEPIFCELK